MKLITLTQGKFAKVDDEDFDYLNQFNWFLSGNKYAIRQDENRKMIQMHREIMHTPPELITDHIDHDGLNNCKSNLRIGNKSDNQGNRRLDKRNSSGYRGVGYDKYHKKWRVNIGKNSKTIFVGYFDCLEKAARAYDKEAIDYFGEFALLNFPIHKEG